MGIEGFDHPFDGRINEVLVLDSIHIISFDDIDYVGEGLEILIDLTALCRIRPLLPLGAHEEPKEEYEDKDDTDGDF
jgi:hypothetical protein